MRQRIAKRREGGRAQPPRWSWGPSPSLLPAYRVCRLRTGACRGKVPDGAGLPLPGTPGAVTLLTMRFYPPRSGRFSIALPVSTALVMLCFHLFHLPPLGLVTLSATERTLRMHSLGALHSVPGLAIWFMGSGCLVSGAGVLHCGLVILLTSLHSRKLTIRFLGTFYRQCLPFTVDFCGFKYGKQFYVSVTATTIVCPSNPSLNLKSTAKVYQNARPGPTLLSPSSPQ